MKETKTFLRKAKNNFAMLLFFLSLFLYHPSMSTAQSSDTTQSSSILRPDDSLYSLIIDINSDGDLVLESGQIIDLWGLSNINVADAEQILIEHYVFCRVLIRDQNKIVGDCRLVPSGMRTVELEGSLSLYHWLPDLGMAQQLCSNADYSNEFTAIIHANQYFFSCNSEKRPRRLIVTD